MKKIVLAALLIVAGLGSEVMAEPFVFTAIPDQDETRLRARFDKVADYLQDKLGVEVQYVPVKSYAAAVTAFRNNQVQLAWFGGLSGVQARLLVPGSEAIAQGYEDQFFETYFIAHESTGLQAAKVFPDGIKGKTFTFGSKGSTSGRLMPEFYIREHFQEALDDVFKNVSLNINLGERLALVGKSGAGKSTLLKLLYEQRRGDAAIIPQELGLVRPLSLSHNVYMGRLHHHPTWYNLVNLVRPWRREVDAVRRVVEPLELDEDKLFEPVGQLSGGQQQRTAVARAMHQRSGILLGDEPVSSVDEHQSRVVLENLTAAHATLVLSLHDVDLAMTYCDRMVGLQNGRIIFDRATAELGSADLEFLYQKG